VDRYSNGLEIFGRRVMVAIYEPHDISLETKLIGSTILEGYQREFDPNLEMEVISSHSR
jgi:hypothetical protein